MYTEVLNFSKKYCIILKAYNQELHEEGVALSKYAKLPFIELKLMDFEKNFNHYNKDANAKGETVQALIFLEKSSSKIWFATRVPQFCSRYWVFFNDSIISYSLYEISFHALKRKKKSKNFLKLTFFT